MMIISFTYLSYLLIQSTCPDVTHLCILLDINNNNNKIIIIIIITNIPLLIGADVGDLGRTGGQGRKSHLYMIIGLMLS